MRFRRLSRDINEIYVLWVVFQTFNNENILQEATRGSWQGTPWAISVASSHVAFRKLLWLLNRGPSHVNEKHRDSSGSSSSWAITTAPKIQIVRSVMQSWKIFLIIVQAVTINLQPRVNVNLLCQRRPWRDALRYTDIEKNIIYSCLLPPPDAAYF